MTNLLGSGRKGLMYAHEPIFFRDEFIVGGRTVVDAALASETDPFGHFISGVAADTTGYWFVSHDTVVAATQLPTIQNDADGGWVLFTTDATSGERISMQLIGEAFKVARGRKLYFEAKLRIGAVTGDAFFGLANTGSTDPHADAPDNYIAFGITGDADIQIGVATGGSDTGAFSGTDTVHDLTAATFTYFGFEWDGVDSVFFYVNGLNAGKLTTSVPIDQHLSPIFCIESNGAAEAMTIDYVIVSCERA